MIFNLAFIQALSALYISVYLLYSAEPCIYSGPGIYISPAFIWMNMVMINLCTNSIIKCNFCISTWNKSVSYDRLHPPHPNPVIHYLWLIDMVVIMWLCVIQISWLTLFCFLKWNNPIASREHSSPDPVLQRCS